MFTKEQMHGLITKPEPELISRYDLINKPEPDELYHFGILGMKWGIRRYQNKDGTLTEAGKRRYSKYFDEEGHMNFEGRAMASAYANKAKRNKDTKIMYDQYQKQQRDAHEKSLKRYKEKLDKIKKEDPENYKKIVPEGHDDVKDTELLALMIEDYNGLKKETGRPSEIVPHDKIVYLMKKNNVSYDQIYSEMSKEDKRFKDLMESEDNDDYRDAEAAWYLKHKDDK